MTGIVIPFDPKSRQEEPEYTIVFEPEGEEEAEEVIRLACTNCKNATYKLEPRPEHEDSEIAVAMVVCAACNSDIGTMGWVDE
jgi:hypothetical protein